MDLWLCRPPWHTNHPQQAAAGWLMAKMSLTNFHTGILDLANILAMPSKFQLNDTCIELNETAKAAAVSPLHSASSCRLLCFSWGRWDETLGHLQTMPAAAGATNRKGEREQERERERNVSTLLEIWFNLIIFRKKNTTVKFIFLSWLFFQIKLKTII